MNDKVIFTEKDHKYTGSSGKNYISTTSIVALYKEEFDEEYWSLYKAIERIVIDKLGKDYFDRTKRRIGFEKVIEHFTPRIQTDGLLQNTINQILNEWKEKRERKQLEGKVYHKKREDTDNEKGICDVSGLKIVKFEDRDLNYLLDGAYTEHVLWNEEFGIAGQADKTYLEGIWIDVDDYKTCDKIPEESFNHPKRGYKMMKYPVDNLMDCKLLHYTLQLSIYAWMLEQKSIEQKRPRQVRRLRLYHSTIDTYIEVPYLKKEVELILNHYRNGNSNN